MTQESTDNLPEVVDAEVVETEPELSFDDRALALLPESDYKEMSEYIKDGNPELALSTANNFFELFISGNDVDAISKMNSAFPKAAINWCRIKYNWDLMFKEHIHKLQGQITEKVIKAQLEATSLYADIITAASKKHSINLKKYIQTGDETYLKKTIDINNIMQLQKAIEGLQKVTNQDKNIKITEEKKLSLDVEMKGTGEELSPAVAAKILAAISEEQRKKDLEKTKGTE